MLHGGDTWTVHQPPDGSAKGYGMAILFLHDFANGRGDKDTWLLTTQSGGFFRTTDAGATWSLVYKLRMTHGGNQLYRTKSGTLNAGAYQNPVRITDNGGSWQPLKKGLVYSWYMGICGFGNLLYTACSNANEPFLTSPDDDGPTWTAYKGSTQRFSSAPFEMHFDPVNRVMYSAIWSDGLFALKVDGPG